MNTTTRLLLVALLATSVVACAKKTKPEMMDDGMAGRDTPVETTPVPDDGMYGPDDLDSDSCLRQRVVYFDYDQADVRGEAGAILACHAKYLKDRPSAMMTLGGHADERGSREYNLGLGERRGNAVSSALMAQGGSGSQINVVSYGEEQGTCSDTSEDCWAKNRRVEISYTAR